VAQPTFVRSADGTSIAVEILGSGLPFVIVNGALSDRASVATLVPLIAQGHAVHAWDRRGRGDSSDTPPYAVAREVEDLAAVVDHAGGPVDLYGHSSGCYLAIKGVLGGLPVRRLVLHEPPFVVTDDRSRPPPDLPGRLADLVAAGDRAGAVRLFYERAAALTPEAVDRIAAGPGWTSLIGLAHTLPYDTILTGTSQPDGRGLDQIDVPTLVVLGGASAPWMAASTRMVAATIPDARLVVLEGQGHVAAAEVLAPEVLRFLDQPTT
jgi:pimeloyl-ACP methyl ester carboxylesterase